MFIEELEEDKVEEQHFVEAQTMQKDTKEENVVEVKELHFWRKVLKFQTLSDSCGHR
jgi:hypothetical protein